jgi:hypothetical protein
VEGAKFEVLAAVTHMNQGFKNVNLCFWVNSSQCFKAGSTFFSKVKQRKENDYLILGTRALQSLKVPGTIYLTTQYHIPHFFNSCHQPQQLTTT